MERKVTLRELLTARVVLAACIAVYYWCWARNGWANYFDSIQNCVAIFAVLFFCFLSARERKYKKRSWTRWPPRTSSAAIPSAIKSPRR